MAENVRPAKRRPKLKRRRQKPHVLMLVANAGHKDARVRREAEALVASRKYKVTISCTQPKGTKTGYIDSVRYARVPIARGFHLPLWWKTYKAYLWHDPLLLFLGAIALTILGGILFGLGYLAYLPLAYVAKAVPNVLAIGLVLALFGAILLRFLLYPLFLRDMLAPRRAKWATKKEKFMFKLKRRLRAELRERIYLANLIFVFGTFGRTMLFNASRQKPIYDVIHAHDLNTMIAGVFLKKKYNAKLVFDAHELAAHEDDRHHIFRRMFKRLLMRRLVKHADRIVTVSQGFDHWFTDKFGKPVLVVYNTPQIADESELDMTVRGAAGLTEDDPLIVYIGGVNERRGSKQMGQAARLLPEHFKLVFVTGAKPHIREQILTEAARDPIEGKGAEIIFLAPVPAKEVVHFMADADASLISRLPPRHYFNPQREYSMPNKLFESTFAGLPIVGGDSKELADFVKRFNLGLPTNCHDPQDMADKIVAVYESRNKFRKGRGEIDAIYKHYGWPTMETKLVAFYDDMLEET